ncbi:hypothetical protein ACJMK2_040349 [Sinanodonta woodiana]|uniref:Uncharacterized protein n=1 Tax=Sinanodonta woodiana TaxID=1069815 RepID=A0ABD3WI75_SINWO
MNVYVLIGTMVFVLGSIGWLKIKLSYQDKASLQYFASKSEEDTITWGLKLQLGENEDVDTENPTFQGTLRKQSSYLEAKIENSIVFKKGIEVPQHIKQLLSIDSSLGNNYRRKRDSNNLYRIDTLMVVDFSLFDRWKEVITKYYIPNTSVGNDVVLELIRSVYMLLIDRVNRRFSQLDDSDMLLRIHVKDIYIVNLEEVCPWNTTTVLSSSSSRLAISARTAQEELFNWLKAGDHVSIRDYNLIFGLTAMTILDDRNQSLQGYLGANEDGKDNNCSAHDQYIMSIPSVARTGQTKNYPWLFSGCTKTEIRQYFLDLPKICLPKLANSTVIPVYTGTLPGSRLTADQQCKIIQGEASYMCRWCINGACVASPRAPLAPDRCVHGDQPVVDFSPEGCHPYITNSKGECYNRTVSLACCQSCSAVSSNTEGCEYGDKENCSSIVARNCYTDSVFRKCCKTCPSYGTGIKECPYGDAVSGCDQSECSSYSESRLTQCCYTCDGRRTTTGVQTSMQSSVSNYNITTSTNATYTAASNKDDSQNWIVPVVVASAGILCIGIIVVSCAIYYKRGRRRCCTIHSMDAQSYDQQKLDRRVSERPPLPTPRDVQGLDLFTEGDGDETYEYIHANDIEDLPDIASSTGGSDSSGGYMEYITKGNAHEYLDLVRPGPILGLSRYNGATGARGEKKGEKSTKLIYVEMRSS